MFIFLESLVLTVVKVRFLVLAKSFWKSNIQVLTGLNRLVILKL